MNLFQANSLSIPPEYTPYVFILIGVVMMSVGLFQLKEANRLRKNGVRTTGLLMRIGSEWRGKEMVEYGVYHYYDEEGGEHVIRGSVPTMPRIGQSSTTVLYNRDNPADALCTDTGVPQLAPLLYTAVGIGITAYGIFQLPL